MIGDIVAAYALSGGYRSTWVQSPGRWAFVILIGTVVGAAWAAKLPWIGTAMWVSVGTFVTSLLLTGIPALLGTRLGMWVGLSVAATFLGMVTLLLGNVIHTLSP